MRVRCARASRWLTCVTVLVAAASAATAQPLVSSLAPRTTDVRPMPASIDLRTSPDAPPAFALRRHDWSTLGVLGASAVVLTTVDRRVDAWARHPGVRDDASLRSLSRVGDVTGSRVSLLVGPAAWLLGRVRGDSGTSVLGLRTTESVVLSGAAIGAIKIIAGRTRPFASADHSPTHWDFWGGSRSDSTRSFASGHTALSAAAAVTLAAEWRRQGMRGWRTAGPPLVYALTSLVGASRIRDRAHWTTDVVSGALVGTAGALVVRRWHDAHPRSRIDRLFLAH